MRLEAGGGSGTPASLDEEEEDDVWGFVNFERSFIVMLPLIRPNPCSSSSFLEAEASSSISSSSSPCCSFWSSVALRPVNQPNPRFTTLLSRPSGPIDLLLLFAASFLLVAVIVVGSFEVDAGIIDLALDEVGVENPASTSSRVWEDGSLGMFGLLAYGELVADMAPPP